MEIIKPFQRKGDVVIVNINKTITEPGVPLKIERLYLQLKGLTNASDKEIERLANEKILEHMERVPGEF
jgi:hypothetical protein